MNFVALLDHVGDDPHPEDVTIINPVNVVLVDLVVALLQVVNDAGAHQTGNRLMKQLIVHLVALVLLFSLVQFGG